MLIGIFADSHDHLDNLRWAVAEFNKSGCDLVLGAGDYVSTFTTPPLRRLKSRFIGVFGDNDGNKRGLKNGIVVVGEFADGPFGFLTPDGTKILVTHMLRDLEGFVDGADVIIYAHTHRVEIRTDSLGRLFINPGETSGWSFRRPTIAILDTLKREARIIDLPALPPIPNTPETAYLLRSEDTESR